MALKDYQIGHYLIPKGDYVAPLPLFMLDYGGVNWDATRWEREGIGNFFPLGQFFFFLFKLSFSQQTIFIFFDVLTLFPEPLTMPKTAFLPFGQGKHMCPGRKVANLIMKTFLWKLFEGKYRLEIAEKGGKIPEPDFSKMGGAIAPKPVQVRLVKK